MPALGKLTTTKVIDILTVDQGRVAEYWGENNFNMLQSLHELQQNIYRIIR